MNNNICKDANGFELHIDDDVMCIVEEDGESNEYEGVILETLPDNKVKVDAECRTMILDGASVFSLDF